MAFTLGNIAIDEVLYGVAQDFDTDDILYTLDQISSASIEVSAESSELVDRLGNVVRTRYNSKSATLTATNAFLHPNIINASSGSAMIQADENTVMPMIASVPIGGKLDVSDFDEADGSMQIIGLMGNGANTEQLATKVTAVADLTKTSYAIVTADDVKTLYVPTAAMYSEGDNVPVQFVVRYDRKKSSGIILKNSANEFPSAVKLTLFCSYTDPCYDVPKPCYIFAPNFMVDPSVTISLDRESQEIDYSGNLNTSFCTADKVLYYIYFPDDDKVISGTSA